jgi:hypothetical protein
MNTYSHIRHLNSQRSVSRGLTKRFNALTGKVEHQDHVSYTTFRDPNGSPLPHLPLLTKRNRYTPHVGKKQLAKAAVRNHVSA